MRNIARMLSLVLIFMIPWEGVVDLPGLGTGARISGLAVAVFWLVTVAIEGRLRKPHLFHIAVCLFVLWNAVSIFWSADISKTVNHLITWVQVLGLVFILWDLYTTRAAILAGLQAFLLGAFVAVGNAIVNYFSGNVFYTNYQRYSPDNVNPDGFGFILALGIPVAWYLGVSKSTTKISPLLKLINYAYIPAAFLGIALSGTRTAMIAAIPGMAFGLASLTRLRASSRAALVVLLAAAVIVSLPYVQTLTSFQRFSTVGTELTAGDLNQRTGIWREGLAALADHPFLGVGSNMYRSVNSLGKVAHNSFISVLVELGVIGFALFGTILVIAVSRALGQRKWDASFWLVMLMVWAIGASTLTYEHRKATWLFLSLIIASAALTRYRDETAPLPRRNESEA